MAASESSEQSQSLNMRLYYGVSHYTGADERMRAVKRLVQERERERGVM